MNFYAHPTAVIDQPCTIGDGTKIWHFAHICAEATIGRNCNFGQNVLVSPHVIIGDNVKVQNNVAIYTGTTIEDDVFLGPSCVLTNITNPRSQVVRRALYEKTLIRRGATVGANATIMCGFTLGRYCFVAAGAVVTSDIPDYGLLIGVPGRLRGWMSRHGHQLHFNEQGLARCPESALRYRKEGDSVRCIDLDEEAALPPESAVGRLSYDQIKRSAQEKG